MKTLILSIVAASAFAAPALAQVAQGPAAAIAHFNQDFDSQDNIRVFNDTSTGVTVSTRSGDLSGVYALFNAQADSQDDIRGLNGATAYGGSPAFGSALFDRIKQESAEDE